MTTATKETHATILRAKYTILAPLFNERTRRIWAATEARAIGHGGVVLVASVMGIHPDTVRAGMSECATPSRAVPASRIRKAGGGRKKLAVTQPNAGAALDALIEPGTRGDPESPLCWTIRSLRTLANLLAAKGHPVSFRAVGSMLHERGYSLQSNRKTKEGSDHPDRDLQFRHINDTACGFIRRKQPVISVDTEKKELIGNFKNNGQEWRKKGAPRLVNMHDFPDKELGKVAPYGIYDCGRNAGWVSVGIDHDTAEFAANAIRDWWDAEGRAAYPKATKLLITADCGGSNGNRVRLWKYMLQQFADDSNLTLHVSHFPPGTSKWNKIEHRLFSFISKHWRGQPLTSRATVVDLIAGVTTAAGLSVRAQLDERSYQTGKTVSDEEYAAIKIKRNTFHGEWNYTILPRQ